MTPPTDKAQERYNRQTAVRRQHAESIPDDLRTTEAYRLFIDQNKAVSHALLLRGSQLGGLLFCPEDYRNKDSCINFCNKHWDIFQPLVRYVSKRGNRVFFSGPLLISERDKEGYEIAAGGYPRDLAKGRSTKRNLSAFSKPSGIVCELIPKTPESSSDAGSDHFESIGPMNDQIEDFDHFGSFESMNDQIEDSDNFPWETAGFEF